MQYPNITLQIKNQIPYIQLRKSADEVKNLILSETGIDTIMMRAADIIGQPYSSVEDIYMEMETGDWEYLQFPQIQFGDDNLNLDSLIKRVEAEKSEFSIPEAVTSSELEAQLLENWREDVLSSVSEEIYNILIGFTVFFAAELAIDNIALLDESESTRLREKMAKELATVEEIDFYIA